MNPGLTSIRLLAFAVAFKRYRRNSIIYRHDKKFQIAKIVGISATTTAKYLNECENLGLIIPHYKERKFIKLTQIIKILFPNENLRAFVHVRFFRGKSHLKQVNEINEELKIEMAVANFKRQNHNIEKNSVIDDLDQNCYKSRKPNCLKALARKHRCSVGKLPSIDRIHHIVTGKNHLSGILGCSPATAAALLRKWDRAGLINRTIVSVRIAAPVNSATLVELVASGHKNIHPSKKDQCYYRSIGSRITLPALVGIRNGNYEK